MTIFLYMETGGSTLSTEQLNLFSYTAAMYKESRVVAIIKSPVTPENLDTIGRYGIDICHLISSRAESPGTWSDYGETILELYRTYEPSLLIGAYQDPADPLFSILSGKLKKPIINNCSTIVFNKTENVFKVEKQLWGGKVNSELTIRNEDFPLILTINPKRIPTVQAEEKKTEIIRIDLPENRDSRIQKIEVTEKNTGHIDVTEASVIITGGRALKSKDDFENICSSLARVINGTAGATRALVDNQIVCQDIQIGQSGKEVNPKLYFAIGVSGAPQHLAGMRGSGTIIAINKDKNAEIFKYADYGVVGDLYKIVPELITLLDNS